MTKGEIMTTMPNMKLPDILDQLRKKIPAGGQGTGKNYRPIQPGRGEKPHEPVQPKGGGARVWPFLAVIVIISIIFAAGEFIKDTEPFKLAAAFVKENRLIREDLGEITEVSPWFPCSLKDAGDTVRVRLTLRIQGRNGTGKAQVTLVYLKSSWRITAAAYENRQGRMMTLTTGSAGEALDPRDTASSGRMTSIKN